MPLIPASSEGGGTFNGGTITTPLVVDQGFGNEGDYQEGDVFLFNKAGASQAELSAFSTGATLELLQNPAATGNKPLRYLDIIPPNGVLFAVLHTGAVVSSAHAAPGDSDIPTSGFGLWLDDAPAATKLMVKAKDSAGIVKTAAIALA